jgi:hypothetical protein
MLAESKKQPWRATLGSDSAAKAAGVWQICHDGRALSAVPFNTSGPITADSLAAFAVGAFEATGAACMRRLLRSMLPAGGAGGASGPRGASTGAGAAGAAAAAAAARNACLVSGACSSPWVTSLQGRDLMPGGRVAESSRPWFVLVRYCGGYKRG